MQLLSVGLPVDALYCCAFAAELYEALIDSLRAFFDMLYRACKGLHCA